MTGPRIRHVTHEQVVDMVREECADHGYTLRQFYEEATDPDNPWRLENPHLRDLWLIWGCELTEADL